MTSAPRPLSASLMFFALVLGSAPASASELVFVPDFPGATFGSITVNQVPSEPTLKSFAPQVAPGPALFFVTLLNLSPDTLSAVDLELGQITDGVFQPGSGNSTFLSPVGFAILGPNATPFSTLSPDSTAAQLDLTQAFLAAERLPAEGSPAGLIPQTALTLDFFVLNDSTSPLDFRLTLTAVPEPATLALTLMGLGAALRRPLRRI